MDPYKTPQLLTTIAGKFGYICYEGNRKLDDFLYTAVTLSIIISDRTAKTIHSDNVLVFLSGELWNFFLEKGIIHQTSYIDKPQQNGQVERKHHHTGTPFLGISSH